MKVLFLTRYIYDNSTPEFARNKTGLGMMVKDIIESVSALDQVTLLTRVITKGGKHKNYNLLSHTWKDIIGSLSIRNLLGGIKEAFIYNLSFKNKLRYFYFYIDGCYVEKIIKSNRPDIVHIHGLEYCTQLYISICEELKLPYIVTLHGLNGLNSSVFIPNHEKELEKEFLIESEKKKIPITVISSGIKKRIISNYGVINGDNIKIINNGTVTEESLPCENDIRKKYTIPNDHKIILCIGNVSLNKNQLQVVRALSNAPNIYRDKITVLFLGNDTSDNLLKNSIDKSTSNINFIYCGFINKDLMAQFWIQADLNIFTSLNDGFGLSIIEGFVYGVPTITFSDLDAIEDLYNEKAMFLVHDRCDDALVKGIESALQIEWDKDWIREYSKEFSLLKIAEEYHNHYIDITSKVNRMDI